jgi:tight adherence protein B
MPIFTRLLLGVAIALFVVWAAPVLLSLLTAQEGVLRHAFEQNNRYLQPKTVRLLTAAAMLVSGGILYLILPTWVVFVVAAALVWVSMPIGLRWHRAKRQQTLQQSLPELCDLVAASLQSGASLRTAISRAENTSNAALQFELHQLLRDMRLGHSTDQAFSLWAQRSRMQAVQDIAFCVRLSSQTGGNLAEALIRLGEALRQQIALQAKAKALTAQGRLQALIMLAMPPMLFLATSALDPFVAEFFLQTPIGWALTAAIAAMEVLGALWVRRIVRFEV